MTATHAPVAPQTALPELNLVGRAVAPERRSHVISNTPAPAAVPFSLEPLVRAQQEEIANLYQLIGSLRHEIALLGTTLRESQHQSHERETDLIRILHRYVLQEQR
ncbi:MAG: hypothetical protein ACP5OR_07130 [Candidatus Dormibacteria bacterium]